MNLFDFFHEGLLQEILLGLTLTPAEKVDLGIAVDTKFCKYINFPYFVSLI